MRYAKSDEAFVKILFAVAVAVVGALVVMDAPLRALLW